MYIKGTINFPGQMDLKDVIKEMPGEIKEQIVLVRLSL